tara:strand:+ start:626 stop:745 length:120 start_codon:yes stop_codon:yes gene_type:complete
VVARALGGEDKKAQEAEGDEKEKQIRELTERIKELEDKL